MEDDVRLEGELPRGDADDKLTTLSRWIEEFEQSTDEHRSNAMRDRAYYDGEQWAPKDLQALSAKNQPPVVMNRIFPRVNDTLGAEDENRTDPRAYPRTFDGHNDDAEAATDALRYWEESTEFDVKSLQVLENLAIEGAGGCVFELEVEPDPGKDGKYDRNVVCLRYVPWDRLFWDPHSRDPFFEDAMYKGILTWMHYNQALKRWPTKAAIIEQTRYNASTGKYGNSTEDRPTWFHTGLNRVAIREIWWREMNSKGHWEWFYAAFTNEGFLEGPTRVEWKTDRGLDFCPLRMCSAFVKNETLERYGLVRHMIWPQDEVNKRRSKALWNFTMDRVIYEEGAVENPNVFARELAQGGPAKVNHGALADGRVQPQPMVDKGQAHLQLAMEAKGEIDELGPYANNPQGTPQDLSARSFFAQQQAGMRKIGPLFQHYRRWKLDVYRHAWFAVRSFWPEERWIRLRDKNDSAGYRFRLLNKKMTRGQRYQELLQRNEQPQKAAFYAYGQEGVDYLAQIQAQVQEASQALQQAGMQADPAQLLNKAMLDWPMSKEPFTAGDLSKLDVDIVIDVSPESTILEHEQFTTMSEMARNGIFGQPVPPKIATALVKSSMLYHKQELIDALNEPPPPEQVQYQQQQMQLQLAAMQAEVEKLKSEAAKNQTAAAQVQGDVEKKRTEAQVGIPAEAERDLAQAAKLRAEIETLKAEAEKLRADAAAKPIETRAKIIAANKPAPKPGGSAK